MGEGEQRRSRRTARYDSRELALLSKKQTPTEADWDEKIAAGSQKLPTALDSRTTTVDDPLTTSLLAEVARRTSTVEVSADQVDAIAEPDEPDEIAELDPGDWADDPT